MGVLLPVLGFLGMEVVDGDDDGKSVVVFWSSGGIGASGGLNVEVGIFWRGGLVEDLIKA